MAAVVVMIWALAPAVVVVSVSAATGYVFMFESSWLMGTFGEGRTNRTPLVVAITCTPVTEVAGTTFIRAHRTLLIIEPSSLVDNRVVYLVAHGTAVVISSLAEVLRQRVVVLVVCLEA